VGSRLHSGRGDSLLTDRNLTVVEELIEFAESRGHTILELAFSWLLTRRAVASVIAGATSSEQARSNAAAASWELTDTELAEVDSILTRAG
jgi:aryl-alcohol dehydrogenase-like predicted oxidoreductase